MKPLHMGFQQYIDFELSVSIRVVAEVRDALFCLFWRQYNIHKFLRSTQRKIVTLVWRRERVNSLTAMVSYMRPLFFELCASLITFQIFVRCQRLIARNVADGFLLFSLTDTF